MMFFEMIDDVLLYVGFFFVIHATCGYKFNDMYCIQFSYMYDYSSQSCIPGQFHVFKEITVIRVSI